MTSAYLDRPLRSLVQAVGDRYRRGTLDLTTARALVADHELVATPTVAMSKQPLMAIDDFGGTMSRC